MAEKDDILLTMPIQKFNARISETQQLTEKYLHLYIELVEPHRLEFTAGQYIMLSIPGIEQKKNYSIASSPTIDHAIELLIDIAPQGIGTTYIKGLKLGDTISFMAPAGMFTVAQSGTLVGDAEKSLVFVASGSGITPIRSMILDQLQVRGDTRPITLYWGLRHEGDLCWLEDWEELERSFANFTFHPILSQAGAEWTLCRGRVTDCLSIHPLPVDGGYYICGNRIMIEDAARLVQSKGILEQHIHHEKFY